MLQTNENIFSMWDSTLAFLDGSTFNWQTQIPFKNGVIKLRDFRSRASLAGQRQHQSSEGETRTKAAMNDRMIALALRVVNNAHAYAVEAGDLRLETATDISGSRLRRMDDTERADAVDAIVTAVTPALTAMADYPISQTDLTLLSGYVRDYRLSLGQPSASIAGHKTATEDADDVRRAGQLLIKRVLDKLVRNFEDTDPGFVSGYFNARVIRDIGGRGGDAPTA